jgi:LuxR family quorum-sensing system transcriptional regulator CciR
LTDRQIDCLLLSAAGKTEWETARILGISLSTVHSHMMQAMRRYGVFNRQQLLFHALRDGLISFADLGFI